MESWKSSNSNEPVIMRESFGDNEEELQAGFSGDVNRKSLGAFTIVVAWFSRRNGQCNKETDNGRFPAHNSPRHKDPSLLKMFSVGSSQSMTCICATLLYKLVQKQTLAGRQKCMHGRARIMLIEDFHVGLKGGVASENPNPSPCFGQLLRLSPHPALPPATSRVRTERNGRDRHLSARLVHGRRQEILLAPRTS